MKEAVSQSLFNYWNDLRGDRPAPKRFEIEPSAIAHHLPDTFILERADYATLPFRLAGTRISEAFGMELRGKNLLGLFNERDSEILQRQMSLITSQAAVGVFEISAHDGKGHATAFEVTILPLVHTRDVVERYLGSVAPIDRPQWLGLVPLPHRSLVRHKLIWPNGTAASEIEAIDRQTPFYPTVREARIVKSARRQFRVYEGGLSRVHTER
ncbi:PAS domain-containing protein [Hyphomicrobium sp. 99]|uniref:PAS domain-containing protein n=1 Tax=Hyphomicrobium sp. 99 TaxID=1163419 RepID=UPI0005F86183|nr:PAS domain-containing protein [Hyphomicrobium sp. 99]